MPAEPVFSLAGLKLPLNSPRQRINGHATGGILGYDDATTVSDPFLDSKYDRRLKRTPSGNSIRSGAPLLVVVRFLKYAVVLLVVFVRPIFFRLLLACLAKHGTRAFGSFGGTNYTSNCNCIREAGYAKKSCPSLVRLRLASITNKSSRQTTTSRSHGILN